MKALATARLALEPLTRAHAKEMFAVLSDPAIYRFIEEKTPVSVGALTERYARLETRTSGDESERWLNWVVRETVSARVAGYVQATVAGERAMIAYVIAPAMQGRGFGREASLAMIDELRASYGVKQLRVSVDRRNAPSIALALSLGFKPVEGGEAADQLYELQ